MQQMQQSKPNFKHVKYYDSLCYLFKFSLDSVVSFTPRKYAQLLT